MPAVRTIDRMDVRRLAVARQHLSAAPVPSMLEVVRNMGCLQLDPISAVQRSHLLVLWSRLGSYDPAEIDRLIYQDRALFEYWAHVASIVLTEDYPIFYHWMRRYPGDGSWGKLIHTWLAEDAASPVPLQTQILERIRSEGALTTRHFEDKTKGILVSSGWTSPRNVSRMFDYLWHHGDIMVSHRKGIQRFWDLSERCLPESVSREALSTEEVVYRAAQRAIRCMGVATPTQIKWHFTRHRYPELPNILKKLQTDGRIEPVTIRHNGSNLPGQWYLHCDDIPLLERIQSGDWQPKTTLLSPFDNLICDRSRLNLLFDFDYSVEIYTPQAKRKYGYYVLPILHGDRLIGRIDPVMDRKTKRLTVKTIFAEDNAPADADTIAAVRGAVASLGAFLGATSIETGTVPKMWSALRK